MFIKKTKKLIALLLSFVMIIGMMPAMTFGLGTVQEEQNALSNELQNASFLLSAIPAFDSDAEAIAQSYTDSQPVCTSSAALLLSQAVTAGQAILSDNGKTATEYSAAKADVLAAIDAFNASKWNVVTTAALNARFMQVTTLVGSLLPSVDGSNVPTDKYWVSPATHTSLMNSQVQLSNAISAAVPRDSERAGALNTADVLLAMADTEKLLGIQTSTVSVNWVSTYPKLSSAPTYNSAEVLLKADADTVAKVLINSASQPPLTAAQVIATGESITLSANVEKAVTNSQLRHTTNYRVNIVLGNSATPDVVTFTTAGLPTDLLAVGTSNYENNDLRTLYTSVNYQSGKVYVWDKPEFSSDNIPSATEMAQRSAVSISANGSFGVTWNHEQQANGNYYAYFMFENASGVKSDVIFAHSYAYTRQQNTFLVGPRLTYTGNQLDSLTVEFSVANPATVQIKLIPDEQITVDPTLITNPTFTAGDEVVIGNSQLNTKTFSGLQEGRGYTVVAQIKGVSSSLCTKGFVTGAVPRTNYTLNVTRPSHVAISTAYTFQVKAIDFTTGVAQGMGRSFTIPSGVATQTFTFTDQVASKDSSYTFELTDAGGNKFRPNNYTACGLSLSSQGTGTPAGQPATFNINIPKVVDIQMGIKLSPFYSNVNFTDFDLVIKAEDNDATLGKLEYSGLPLSTITFAHFTFKAIEQAGPLYMYLQSNYNDASGHTSTAYLTESVEAPGLYLITGSDDTHKKQFTSVSEVNNLELTLVSINPNAPVSAPTFVANYPSVSISNLTATFKYKSNVDTIMHYAVQPANQATVTATELLTLNTVDNMKSLTANTEGSFTYTGAAGAYKFSALVKNANGNSVVVTKTFTLTAPTSGGSSDGSSKGGGGGAIATPTPSETSTTVPTSNGAITPKPVVTGDKSVATATAADLAKATTVKVEAMGTTYVLPTSEVTTTEIAKVMGAAATEIKSVAIEVIVTKSTNTINPILTSEDIQLITPLVEFNVVAKATMADGTIKDVVIDKFTQYITREFEIKPIVGKTIVGVVVQKDGSYTQVPTTTYNRDGKTYAKLSSLSNSTYGVLAVKVDAVSANKVWNKDVINTFIAKGIIDEKSFSADRQITRIEFVKMLVKALGIKIDLTAKSTFNDVIADAGYVSVAQQMGIITGNNNNQFLPNNTLTREEMAVMLMRANKVLNMTKLKSTSKTFTDASKVSKWAKDMLTLADYEVFNGYTDGTLRPQNKLSEAEAAQVIYNALKNAKLID